MLAGSFALALPGRTLRADDDSAQADLAGTYAIQGTFPNGKAYTGTLEFKPKKTVALRRGPKIAVWDLSFHYSTGWVGTGVGGMLDRRFYFALAKPGQESEHTTVAIYRPLPLGGDIGAFRQEFRQKLNEVHKKGGGVVNIKGDPWWGDLFESTYDGLFFELNGDLGCEEFGDVPLGPGGRDFWRHYLEDNGKRQYKYDVLCNFDISPTDGDALMLVRTRDDHDKWVNPTKGVGLMPDSTTMVVGYLGGGSEGVGYFDVSGKTLTGRICDRGQARSYAQTATPPDDVAARNPMLFH